MHRPHLWMKYQLHLIQPWQIRPDVLRALLLRGGGGPELLADDPEGPPGRLGIMEAPQVEVERHVAVLPVHGVILKNASAADHYYGDVADLAVIDQQIENIAADDRITSVLLDVRSPGGTAQGVQETADRIRALSEHHGKRVTAYADQIACSAGYYLAAAADEVLAAPSAEVGSISTIASLVDASESLTQAGLALHIAKTGDHKDFGYYGKSVTEQDLEQLRELVAEADDEFKSFIRARRPGADPTMTMTGKWFSGGRALRSGLVDGLAPSTRAVALGLLMG